ncbi:MAG: phosphatase PAP2 family protein [Prevotella sp.]|nr:phosphatase PAP2 family protein [Prevotella sp.]
MRTKTFIILFATLFFGGISTQVLAEDYRNLEELKLTTPTMEPCLTIGETRNYIPELELSVLPTTTESNAYQLTWMRTNPGVEPYKVMDDLTFAGVPIFVAGIIAKSEKKSFRQNTEGNKHTLLTDFKTHIDDYSQFFGPVVTTGLKIAGVEGRSDWGRYLASTAMSYGIMAIFVNSIKYTAKEMRPDGSTANSWPSGHTATAFVGATLLHKEYGMTRSPWFSVAGYGVATATGVMRVLNNRHWVSDVLSGAGIGIMSGELAYALSDVLFKGRGLLRGDITADKSIIDHPSFFSISMGIGMGSRDLTFDMTKLNLTNFDGDNKLNMKFGASTAVGAEGAYFFNKYIGVGGRLRVNSSPIKGWDGIEEYAWKDLVGSLYGDDYAANPDFQRFIDGDENSSPLIDDAYFTIKSDHLTEFSADLGLYFNLPLSSRFALGSKLLVGRSIMQELDLNATVTGGKRTLDFMDLVGGVDDENLLLKAKPTAGKYTSEWDYFTLSCNNTMKFGTGISLTYAYKENYAWRLFLDYDFSHKTYTMNYNPAVFAFDAISLGVGDESATIRSLMEPGDLEEFIETQQVKKNRHTFILGGSFTISF